MSSVAGGIEGGRQKRVRSPRAVTIMPRRKRTALGDVTNNVSKRRTRQNSTQQPVKPQKKTGKRKVTIVSSESAVEAARVVAVQDHCPHSSSSRSSASSDAQSGVSDEVTPVTAMQHSLQATSLSDECVLSTLAEEREKDGSKTEPQVVDQVKEVWRDIDQEDAHDSLYSSEYAPGIYVYMKQREESFALPGYMATQPNITASMRAILVDWLIEVQENFELYHETLYLSVQLTDRYLSVTQVRKEYLQLVGATCMLIAAKFEELSPPLVDDFLYLCDDAYSHEDLLKMERDILKQLKYDINIPVAYRFLRRLARAADATMETHTLARYISESTLQVYSFVTDRPSYIAAGAMYLALRMRRLGAWTPTLEHYSGYSVCELLPLVQRLNSLLLSPLGETATVRSKYSHEVFFSVALLPALADVRADADAAMALEDVRAVSITQSQTESA